MNIRTIARVGSWVVALGLACGIYVEAGPMTAVGFILLFVLIEGYLGVMDYMVDAMDSSTDLLEELAKRVPK